MAAVEKAEEIAPGTSSPPPRVLLDPGGAVHLMENHDDALRVWQQAGARNRVLVHIDAHHDMFWVPSADSISIANFICPALEEGVVREAFWVVPDHTWDTAAGRRALHSHVRALHQRYPGAPAPLHEEPRRFHTTLLGRPLTICSLDSLQTPLEPVLLDIDTDYLTIPQVSYGEWDIHGPLPWRWPEELVELLHARRLRTDLATIAYSVEGGHTPLQWKYLGDELAFRLRCSGGGDRLKAYDRMRQAAQSQDGGDARGAEAGYRAIGDAIGAAPHFRLAHLLAEQGRADEARTSHRRAVALDPAYRTAYSSPGVTLYFAGAYQEAARAFERSLLIDPSDVSANIGLGWLAERRNDWKSSEDIARVVLRLQPDSIDGWRLLGRSLAKQRRFAEAIAGYERSLKLALAGGRPFDGVVVTGSDQDRLLDSGHPRTHARLARLYARTGDKARALAGFRIAIAGGFDIPAARFHAARLSAGQGLWRDAFRHARAAVVQLPRAVRASIAARARRTGGAPPDAG